MGLADEVMEEYFPGTVSRIGGIDLATIEREVLMRHEAAYVDVEDETDLELGGQYQWRLRGERHLHNPDTIHKLQHAARTNDYELYREYARLIDHAADAPITLRNLLEFNDLDPDPHRRGRARQRDRQALRHRGHVLRLDLAGRPTPRWPSP